MLFAYRLASQCTAQLYSYITKAGGLAKMTTCVGHSLGAHVCGMISNHLTEKQHKIVGKLNIVIITFNISPVKYQDTDTIRLSVVMDKVGF